MEEILFLQGLFIRNNDDLKERHYVYAPMLHKGEIIPVKLTVKEFNTEKRGIRLYSVEAIDVILSTKKRMLVDRRLGLAKSHMPSPARHPYKDNIANIFDSVNCKKSPYPNLKSVWALPSDVAPSSISPTGGEKFILTGYALHDKKEKAAVAIEAVSALYGNTLEFSVFQKQVGAVLASLP